MRAKAVLAVAETKSFARAAVVLDKLGEIIVSSRHLGRLAGDAGAGLLEAQRERAERFQRGSLPVEALNPPEVAVVEMDGGRIRTRAEGRGAGTHDPAWRESKTALFQRMTSKTHAADPCPDLPDFLQNRSRVRHIVLDMSGTADGVEAPPVEERSDDPRRIVGRSLTYLTNNRSRMDYPSYRRAGLPISSALMESLIKEINWRVKGTEKFWNDPGGANPILALKAASLCDDGRLEKLLNR